MKYIIDINPIDGTNLYKAEGFNTLVFDGIGLSKLTPMECELKDGSIIKTPNGTTLYKFMGFADDGTTANCINLKNNKFSTLSNFIVVG